MKTKKQIEKHIEKLRLRKEKAGEECNVDMFWGLECSIRMLHWVID